MKVSIPPYRCPLGRSTQRVDPDSIKREGWRDMGLLAVSAGDQRLNWAEKEFIRQIGEKLYGGSPKVED